jgi:hypothetical protein
MEIGLLKGQPNDAILTGLRDFLVCAENALCVGFVQKILAENRRYSSKINQC